MQSNDWKLDPMHQFDEGADAFHYGKPVDENPWREGTVLHDHWQNGWEYAEDTSGGVPCYTPE